MNAPTIRISTRLLAPAFLDGGIGAGIATRFMELNPPAGIHGMSEDETISPPAAMARTVGPPAALSGLIGLGTVALRAINPALATRVVRFTNLGLASLLAGNGVGSVLWVHPALDSLPEDEYFRSEQAISRRYPDAMRTLMPATVASCLAALWLNRDRGSVSFDLTLAGAAAFVAVLGLTGLEVPINKRTLTASSEEAPADWGDLRTEWNRFNQLRVLCEIAGWSCLCVAALAESRGK